MHKMEISLESDYLRRAMRYWASGVSVVTSFLDGDRHGMTVSSFTSLSLDPPLILVALERGTRTQEMVTQSKVFGITILSDRQRDISDRFAGRFTDYEDRFDGLDTYTLVTGVSLINGGLAGLDCVMTARHDVGSHAIIIGEVRAVKVNNSGQPLIYYNRTYWNLGT